MLGAAGMPFNNNIRRRSRNEDDRFLYKSPPPRHYDVISSDDHNSRPISPEPSPLSNLERFLESVTPILPAHYLSKMKARSWRTRDSEFQPFFMLSDLWESFKEWSAYGVGVPVILKDNDSVVQYYVPYLSGIQLYTHLSNTTPKLRRLDEESDGRDSSSEGSSDSDQDRGGLNYSMQQPNYIQTCNSSLGVDKLSLEEQHMAAFQEGFSSDEGESATSHGCLLFEYLERNPPFSREPLATKISDLALRFPELKSIRSCDLLPSSWISVAWYPIYRIPTGPTLKDLDACFLTFHSLHTPITGSEVVNPPIVTYPTESDGVPQFSLPVFGLASYKYKSSLWTPNGGFESQMANTLMQAADNWLNLVQVNHPDFSFFTRR